MSSISSTTPDHRLVFDGMDLTLYAPGSVAPVARADLSAPDMARQVADLAAATTRSRQGLTVILPEAEIWRGTFRLGSRTPWGRRAEALADAEAAMGVGRDSLEIVVGPRAGDGDFPVAAIRRQSIVDTLVFLDRTDLRASALTGAGEFPGFEAPPLFRIGGRDWPSEAAAVAADLAKRLPPISRPKALAASGAAALALLAIALFGGEDPAPAAAPVPVATVAAVPDVIFPVADAPEAAPVGAAPAVLMRPLAPRARPEDLPEPASSDRVEAALPPLPPALRPDGAADARPVTIASRTTPIVPAARTAARPEGLTLAVAPIARARVEPNLNEVPALVTAISPASIGVSGETAASEPAPPQSIEPSRVATPASAEAPVEARQPSATRPKPRSISVTTEALAETVRSALATVETSAATRPPLAASTMLPAAPPEPRRLVAAATSPKPIAVRAAVLAASAAPEPKAVTPPRPVPVAVAKPEPVVVARAAPAAEPAPAMRSAAPATSRAASERTGLSRNSVSLLGVFGSSKDRYALLRLPNGSVKRVGAGDSVQGVRVAAVSRDAVRLTQGQRDTVLRMPD